MRKVTTMSLVKGFLSLLMRLSNKQTMLFILQFKISTSLHQFHMGENVLLNAYKWMKYPCLPWKVRYLNVLSIILVQKLLNNNLEPNSDAGKCQLFISLLKSRSFPIGRRILGINTLRNTESSSHIVKSLVKAFTSIGKKSRSKYCNIARCVLAESIVSRSTRQRHLIKCTSEIFNLNKKTLNK